MDSGYNPVQSYSSWAIEHHSTHILEPLASTGNSNANSSNSRAIGSLQSKVEHIFTKKQIRRNFSFFSQPCTSHPQHHDIHTSTRYLYMHIHDANPTLDSKDKAINKRELCHACKKCRFRHFAISTEIKSQPQIITG